MRQMGAARRIGLHRLGEHSSRRVFQRLRRRRRLGKRQRARRIGAPAELRWISSTAARSIPTGSNSPAAVHAARFRRRHGLELEGEDGADLVWLGAVGRSVRFDKMYAQMAPSVRPLRHVTHIGPHMSETPSTEPNDMFSGICKTVTESAVAFAND